MRRVRVPAPPACRRCTRERRRFGDLGLRHLGRACRLRRPRLPDALHELDAVILQDALRTALDGLPEPEREVLKLRYGLDLEQPTALRETGRRLGMSSDAVRKLERKALAELAESRELEGLRPAA